MEFYYKEETLKKIVKLFVLFNLECFEDDFMFESSYLEQFINSRFSLRVRLEMLDTYKQLKEKLKETENDSEKRILQIGNILNNISSELSNKQKVELYVNLIDLVIDNVSNSDESKKNRINQFHNLLVTNLSLSDEEIKSIFLFVNNNIEHKSLANSLLVVGNFEKIKLRSFQTYNKKDIEGKIYMLYIHSISSFLFRYVGNKEYRVNKQVIFPNRVYQLNIGGVIEGNNCKPLFYSDIFSTHANSDAEIIELEVCGISKLFKSTGLGVQELSFKVNSGQLCAIMGGSGTGKTTLMNMLCGLDQPDHGEVLINNTNIHNDITLYKQFVGYVPQDDLLIEELTVYQNLKFALLLTQKNLNKNEIDKQISDILTNLGIQKIKNLKVGNTLNKVISGGQRKRLNIALELIRNPEILFVDEPTSGLSSSDAYLVLKLLKDIANSGSIVIINIHQPPSDIFLLFDKLLILDENGYAAYFGSPFTASSYFKQHLGFVDSINDDNLKHGNCNPEEIISLMEHKKKSNDGDFTNKRIFKNADWHKFFLKQQSLKTDKPIHQKLKTLNRDIKKIPGLLSQFWIYFKRNVKVRQSDIQYLFMVFAGAPILALSMSFFLKSTDIVTHEYLFIENENIPAYLFISVVVSMFFGLIISSGEIFRDLKILKRESFLNLSCFSYLSSKLVYLAKVFAIQMFMYVLIGNYILEIKGLLWEFWIILWLTALSSSMLGLFISSIFKSMLSIYITIPFMLIPQILLAGAILDYDKIHHSLTSNKYVPIFADVNLSRWAFESLVMLQFADNDYDKDLLDLYVSKSHMTYHANFYIPKIETKLNEYDKGASAELKSELTLLLNELGEQYPRVNKELSRTLINKENILNIANTLKRIKKWLRANANEVNLKIDNYRKIHKSDKKITKLKYRNQNLSDIVLKSNNFHKYIYNKGELIRKFQPGYYVSDHQFGRSHYYAPYKKVGNYKIKTWQFNAGAIFIIGFIFYLITLYSLRRKF